MNLLPIIFNLSLIVVVTGGNFLDSQEKIAPYRLIYRGIKFD